MKDYFIHIGMPRTGTTFLQKKVFPNIDNHHFYNIEYTYYSRAFQRMIYADDTLYNPAEFKKAIDELKGDKIILSNELLVGQSLFMHYGNRSQIARRLQEAMPNATIVLYIRNQLDILKSLYLISVNWKETKSLEDFIWFPGRELTLDDYHDKNIDDLSSHLYYNTHESHEHVEGYLYKPLIDLYKSLFPKVEIVLYEDFATEPKTVLNQLEKLFGQEFNNEVRSAFLDKKPVHKSIGKRNAELIRKANKWQDLLEQKKLTKRTFNKYRRYIEHKVVSKESLNYSKKLKQKLIEYYQPYNRELHAAYPEIGIDRYKDQYLL